MYKASLQARGEKNQGEGETGRRPVGSSGGDVQGALPEVGVMSAQAGGRTSRKEGGLPLGTEVERRLQALDPGRR